MKPLITCQSKLTAEREKVEISGSNHRFIVYWKYGDCYMLIINNWLYFYRCSAYIAICNHAYSISYCPNNLHYGYKTLLADDYWSSSLILIEVVVFEPSSSSFTSFLFFPLQILEAVTWRWKAIFDSNVSLQIVQRTFFFFVFLLPFVFIST